MGQVTPGADSGGSLARRIGKLERFLSGLSRQRIRAENDLGFPYIYPVLSGTAIPDGQRFKPFSFALSRHSDGASIYYGQLLVAINQTSLNSVSISTEIPEVPIWYVPPVQLTIEQQEIPNPTVYVPTNLDTDDLLKPTKLDWFGDVFLEWGCDENAVMDPAKVKISGPETPSALPIPAYSNGTPPPETDCLYFIKIGSVPEDGKIVQNWASDVYWQPHLIRGGGTGL